MKASEEEPRDEWQNRLMANVEESLNVRTEASEESALAGKLRKGDVAEVTERGEEWSKITSGNVSGYVKMNFVSLETMHIIMQMRTVQPMQKS